MFAIYKYTFKKYLKAPSTWIITLISIFIAGFLGGYLPSTIVDTQGADATTDYAMQSIMVVSQITSFLAIFVSVFAGFKASAMFKDEVEDGTFLVILSKPIVRSKIIFGKWLALQSMMLLYTFATILTFVLTTVAFDKGGEIVGLTQMGVKTLSSQIALVGLLMWSVLMVIGFIFTSIGLLLSTKLSSSATVGISIALGVVIPVTSLVAMFTVKPAYNKVENNEALAFSKSFAHTKSIFQEKMHDLGIPTTKASGVLSLVDKVESLYSKAFEQLNSEKDGLLNLGISTGGKDSFKFAWVGDINYQIKSLSSFASERVVPDALKEALQSSSKVAVSTSLTTKVIKGSDKITAAKMSSMLKNAVVSLHEIQDTLKQSAGALLTANLAFDPGGAKYTWGHIGVNGQKPQNYQNKYDIASWEFKNGQKRTPIEQLILRVHEMSDEPLQFIFKKDKLDKMINRNNNINISHDLQFSEVFKDNNHLIDWNWYSSPMEKEIYESLVSFAQEDPNAMKIVESVEYVSRNTILWIYLAISALLLPLTYLVIRRQDFR